MIHPSLFLRRAIQADAIFSGASALLLTFGAGALVPWLNLPENLLRETGLFLIAYAALVGWLGTRQSMPKPLVVIVISGNAAWTLASGVTGDDRMVHVSLAKAQASEAALLAARKALQVHGAIGYTVEYDLHMWMKRAWALAAAWGDAGWHRNRVKESLLKGSTTNA